MNIPIPEGEIWEVKITCDGELTHDGIKTPRIFCDNTEIPAKDISSVSILLDSLTARVTIKLMARPDTTVEIDAHTVTIEEYTPIGVQRMEKKEKERGWITE